eukprot:scaffold303395_cov30-Tisochrysis_lutea.AAC.3
MGWPAFQRILANRRAVPMQPRKRAGKYAEPKLNVSRGMIATYQGANEAAAARWHAALNWPSSSRSLVDDTGPRCPTGESHKRHLVAPESADKP